MNGILEIPAIGELWSGSSLVIPSAATAGVAERTEYIPYVLACLIVAVLIFSRQIIYGVTGSAAILFTPANRSDLADGISFRKAANITMALCIPAATLILVLTGISRQGLGTTAAALCAYLLLQISFDQLCNLFSNPDYGKLRLATERSIFILFTVVTIPAAILAAAAPWGKIIAFHYTGTAAILTLLLYAISSFRTIFNSGFSYFFSFLYLCGIQFLPLAVTVRILLD